MIKAVFTYPDQKLQSIVDFPSIARGLRRNGERPIRCVVSGDIENESAVKLHSWIVKHLVAVMDKNNKDLVVDVLGFDFDTQ